MKNIVGVIVITSVVTLGGFVYYQLTYNKETLEPDTGQATINEPVVNPPIMENQTPDTKKETETTKQEENKQLPDLESFKGLEEESSSLFEVINDLPESGEGNPLKDVLQ